MLEGSTEAGRLRVNSVLGLTSVQVSSDRGSEDSDAESLLPCVVAL